MDVPTLILLGAAGGVLRAVVDFYVQFVNWRSARGVHLREQPPERDKPRFRHYFDPAVDLAAAGVHSVMGAGLAVLFGSTGQISGPYAAIVVGISAPVLLTQLARIQAVSDALGGGQTAAGTGADAVAPAVGAGAADPAQQPVPSALQPTVPEPGAAAPPDGSPVAVGSGAAPAAAPPVTLQPDAEPTLPQLRSAARLPDAGPALPQQPESEPAQPQRTSSSLRSAAFQPDTDAAHPQQNGRPADLSEGTGQDHGGRGTPPLRGEPAVGEEGRP